VRAGLPGVPHLMSASPGDARIIASYAVPPTDGGSPIFSYLVVATPNEGDPTSRSDCSTTTLTCVLTGLVNGTPYRVKVAAVTEAGVGDFSVESEPVMPFAAPEAVRDLAGVRRDESLQLTWIDPPNLGGGALVRYDVSYRERGTENYGSPTPVTVASTEAIRVMSSTTGRGTTLTGLTKGKTYDVKVVTVTSLSASPGASSTAEAVVPKMNVAEPPRNLSIEATSASTATVAWATPLRDGGSPLTAYTVSTTGGTCTQASPLALTCDLRDLPAGATVTVTVKASTRVGSSDGAIARVSMPARPSAPKITAITRKGTSAFIEWTAPTTDGGRPVTSYRLRGVSTLDGRDIAICSSTDLSCTVEGLSMSAAYNFTARAYNAVGEGAASANYFAQAFSAVPAVWGSISESTERIAIGLPPAPGSVKVLSSSARRSNVIATAPKTSIPITHAIITVAGAKGRVVLRVKVAVNQANPQAAITIPYSSRSVSVAVQFANAFGVSAMAATGWKPATQITRLTDAASNVQRGVTSAKMIPFGSTVGAPVYFIGASSQLSAAAKAELARIAAILKHDGGIVNVTGYARYSPSTSTAFMRKVSEQRALVVANYLATLGVQQWIRFQGVGSPTTKTGPDTDRRVVVSITPFD
ncbi:MAG: fibronectin type III domain-containing protein, partial [Actinomycetota bacterium]